MCVYVYRKYTALFKNIPKNDTVLAHKLFNNSSKNNERKINMSRWTICMSRRISKPPNYTDTYSPRTTLSDTTVDSTHSACHWVIPLLRRARLQYRVLFWDIKQRGAKHSARFIRLYTTNGFRCLSWHTHVSWANCYLQTSYRTAPANSYILRYFWMFFK